MISIMSMLGTSTLTDASGFSQLHDLQPNAFHGVEVKVW